MVIDFDKWNKEFGGPEAVKAVEEAKENVYKEVPEGRYICSLEKLELGDSKTSKPMVKAQFRILEGGYKKQCLFYNGVMAANDPKNNGFCIHNVLTFLRSLQIFDDSEIDFDGNFRDFNNLLLDLAEEAEELKFEIETAKDGEYTRLTVKDVFE